MLIYLPSDERIYTVKARLDGIYSPDLPSGQGDIPKDPANCWVIVHADIGSEGGKGADCFTIYVTTPQFLQGCVAESHYQLGRGLIIVSKFDWDLVEQAIKEVCSELDEKSWPELAEKLSRQFICEYE